MYSSRLLHAQRLSLRMAVAALAAAVIGCSGCRTTPPTAAEASARIKAAPEFKKTKQENLSVGFTVPADRLGHPDTSLACTPCAAFESLGLAHYEPDPTDPKLFAFVLTAKGQQAALHWINAGRPASFTTGTMYEVTIATRELTEVSSITPVGDGFTVTFGWRWVPNQIGGVVAVSTEVRHTEAFLRKYSIGWRIEGTIEGLD